MIYMYICIISLFLHIVYESEFFVEGAVPFERLKNNGIEWPVILCFIPFVNVLFLIATMILIGIDIFRKFVK